MVCSRVHRLGSSLEVATEGMIVAAEVEATTQGRDRISAEVMDRVVTDVEEVVMVNKVAMAMDSKVATGMVNKVETAMASKVAMVMAMEADTPVVDMAEGAAVVVEGDIRSERDEMTRREFVFRFVEK
jgi:hypothetical protein